MDQQKYTSTPSPKNPFSKISLIKIIEVKYPWR